MDAHKVVMQPGQECRQGKRWPLQFGAQPAHEIRHAGRCFFRGGKIKDLAGGGHDVIRLSLVASGFDPFPGRFSLRRFRRAPESLLEEDAVQVADIAFRQGAPLLGQGPDQFNGDIVSAHLLVFTQQMLPPGATVNQQQQGFAVGQRVALDVVGVVVPLDAQALPESALVGRGQGLRGQPVVGELTQIFRKRVDPRDCRVHAGSSFTRW